MAENENTNCLIRQYFPKKTDFTQVTESGIKEVQRKLNVRPHRAVNFYKPNEVFNTTVAVKVRNHIFKSAGKNRFRCLNL
jgi:IS30 family transposase